MRLPEFLTELSPVRETLVARDIIQNDPAPGDTITVDVKDGALALV